MKKIMTALLIILLAIILLVGSLLGIMWNHRKVMIRLEEKVEAKYLANQSNYDAMWKSMVEATQVTELQAEQFKDVYTGLITGRNQDQNLLFKSIQEQNPQLDTSVYKQLQQNIADNRKVFDNNQKALLDIIKEYNTYRREHFITSMIFHCEEIDSKQYITTSDQTTQAFDTNKADSIDLLQKNKR